MIRILITAICLIALYLSMNPTWSNEQSHEQWLADRIKEAHSVKAGMSRVQLLKHFEVEGGLQPMLPNRYVLKSCHMIKVDVTFDGAGKHAPKKPVGSDADLVILTISPLYLDFEICD